MTLISLRDHLPRLRAAAEEARRYWHPTANPAKHRAAMKQYTEAVRDPFVLLAVLDRLAELEADSELNEDGV